MLLQTMYFIFIKISTKNVMEITINLIRAFLQKRFLCFQVKFWLEQTCKKVNIFSKTFILQKNSYLPTILQISITNKRLSTLISSFVLEYP